MDHKIGKVDFIDFMLLSRVKENESGNPVALYENFEYDFKTGQFEASTSRIPSPNKYLKMILSDLENQ